ncbi:MAG: hypothetical protein GY714_23655 [Desulfobacterales bacterium]|nr:hypothetical protein [Desulfobacterales bacterium]
METYMNKKRVLLRVLLIGALHSTVYLWLIPFVILPVFGDDAVISVVVVTVIVSLLIFGTVLINKKK